MDGEERKVDAIRGCFYEFKFAKVLDAFQAASDAGRRAVIVELKRPRPRSRRPDEKQTEEAEVRPPEHAPGRRS